MALPCPVLMKLVGGDAPYLLGIVDDIEFGECLAEARVSEILERAHGLFEDAVNDYGDKVIKEHARDHKDA